MRDLKGSGLTDRLAAAAEAKAALLAKLKPKPAVTDPLFDQRREMREAELKADLRSEEHTSELQSRQYLVCRLLLEKKKKLRNCHAPLLLCLCCLPRHVWILVHHAVVLGASVTAPAAQS